MMPSGLIVVSDKTNRFSMPRSEPGLYDPKPGGFGYVSRGEDHRPDETGGGEATDGSCDGRGERRFRAVNNYSDEQPLRRR